MISEKQVLEAQKQWGEGVVKIGSLKDNTSECETFTNEFLEKLYSFNEGPVLFKPTKCEIEQFRPEQVHALSKIELVMKIKVLLYNLGLRSNLKTQTLF